MQKTGFFGIKKMKFVFLHDFLIFTLFSHFQVVYGPEVRLRPNLCQKFVLMFFHNMQKYQKFGIENIWGAPFPLTLTGPGFHSPVTHWGGALCAPRLL